MATPASTVLRVASHGRGLSSTTPIIAGVGAAAIGLMWIAVPGDGDRRALGDVISLMGLDGVTRARRVRGRARAIAAPSASNCSCPSPARRSRS